MVLVSPDDPPTLRESETDRLIRQHFYWEPRHQAAATSIHERSMNVEGMAKRHLALYEAVVGAA